ncbi:MAG TPA: DUF6065 family protein [Humisphaera sp.]|nr:DUF6065 family protein [Humisphaera sp.]
MPERLQIKYRTAHKGLPPQPIRMKIPGWGGSPDRKMVNGSEPEPWHCLPLVEACTYGLELIFQYETECHIINDDGNVRLEWDYAKEPGGIASPLEMSLFRTKPTRFYSFITSIDLQTPPGYVLQTQPHPRYYFDETDTTPLALSAHVQSEWWPVMFLMVFKVPPRGHRHIFRKGEPYAKVLATPQRMVFEAIEMTDEEMIRRLELDAAIMRHRSYIAKNIWHNPRGSDFNDHYKVLAHAFARNEYDGIKQVIAEAAAEQQRLIPPGLSVEQYLELAAQHVADKNYEPAKAVYFLVREMDPTNADAAAGLATVAAAIGLHDLAAKMMAQAEALRIRSGK